MIVKVQKDGLRTTRLEKSKTAVPGERRIYIPHRESLRVSRNFASPPPPLALKFVRERASPARSRTFLSTRDPREFAARREI